jgi:hypothetical protein
MSDVEPVAADSPPEEVDEDAEYLEGAEHPKGAGQMAPQAEVVEEVKEELTENEV